MAIVAVSRCGCGGYSGGAGVPCVLRWLRLESLGQDVDHVPNANLKGLWLHGRVSSGTKASKGLALAGWQSPV